jgi:hypothetical protein
MASHKLSLEVPTVMNTCILKVMDTSIYSDIVPVTCPTLHITVPGFGYSNELEFTPGGSKIITACDLQLQIDGCLDEVYMSLPDGVYIIKYSVSPNDQVYVEYNHLRVTKALHRYKKALCDLELINCGPEGPINKKLEELRKVRMYLEAAQAAVETCHEPQKGMTLYNYAIKILNKLDCKNC